MLLQKIRLKGFLGHRGILGADGKADFVEVDFNDSPLWLIHGDNGGGKSSFWDALTFAFFKQHRGSENKESASFKHLIHEKETDVAEIEVEFELNSQNYRICGEIGKKKDGGATANRILYKLNEDGEEVFQDGDKKVETWLKENLPFSLQTFTSSILLRQGEADIFLKAKASERKTILLKLLNLDFYEELRRRASTIHTATKKKAGEKLKEIVDLQNPTDEKIQEQKDLIETAKNKLQELGEQKDAMNTELKHAVDAAKWRNDIAGIEEKKASDEELFAKADLIEKEVARFRELDKVFPSLGVFWQYKNDLTRESEGWRKSQERIIGIEAELEKLGSVEEAKQKVKEFKRKQERKQSAREKLVDDLNKCENNLSSLRQNLDSRNKITGKEECPLCGSELSNHSERLQKEIESWKIEIGKLEREREILGEDLKKIKGEFEQAGKDFQESADDLRKLENNQIAFDTEFNAEQRNCEGLRLRVEKLNAQIADCHQQIPSDWQNHKAIEDEAELKELGREKEGLRSAKAKAENLSEAFKRCEQFKGELKRLQKLLDEISTERTVGEVEKELAEKSDQISLQNTEIGQAEREAEKMERQKAEYRKLFDEQKEEERKAFLWERLAKAFNGLKMQIIQSAQDKVQSHANETLERLNDNFRIELDKDSPESEELKIYVSDERTDGKRLFEFFSGGESLLLAVSLAVAIGQATHGKNVANTLIIDEGFGALDENKRGSMTEELKRLSEVLHGARVIAVSHQKDVIKKFPYRYEIGKDAEGFTEIRRN